MNKMTKCILEETVLKAGGDPLEAFKQIDPQLMIKCAENGCKKCKPYINLIKGLIK